MGYTGPYGIKIMPVLFSDTVSFTIRNIHINIEMKKKNNIFLFCRYDCKNSKLLEGDFGWWVSRSENHFTTKCEIRNVCYRKAQLIVITTLSVCLLHLVFLTWSSEM